MTHNHINYGGLAIINAMCHINSAMFELGYIELEPTDKTLEKAYKRIRRETCEQVAFLANYAKTNKSDSTDWQETLEAYEKNFNSFYESMDNLMNLNPKVVYIKIFLTSIQPAFNALIDTILDLKNSEKKHDCN